MLIEESQSWPPNTTSNYTPSLSKSPSLSLPPQLEETHSTPPPLSGDASFNNLKSYTTTLSMRSTKPSASYSCTGSIKIETPQISCLAARGPTLFAATAREINLYDLKTLTLVGTLGPSSGMAKSIVFGRRWIFTAHQDSRIRIWRQSATSSDGHRHRLISTLPTFKDRIFRCLLPRNYVQIRRHERRLWVEHADAVSALAVDGGAGLIYSASWDRCFKVWEMSQSGAARCMGSVRAHEDAVNAVVVGPPGRTVYTASADGQIRVWAAAAGDRGRRHRLVATLEKHGSSVNTLALTGDGSSLCSGGVDGLILVWEREKFDEKSGFGENEDKKWDFFVACCLKGHKGAVLCLVQVKGLLISGSSDRTVRVWGFGGGFRGCLAILKGHCKPVKSLVAVPGDVDDMDGSLWVFSGSLDGEIRAWKISISSLIGCD